MRLSSLELKQFRCFDEEQLDLSDDVVAIYGRNGTGKTSIFDAIEFALFGKVQRLADPAFNPRHVAYLFGTGRPRVTLRFSGDAWTSTEVDQSNQLMVESSGGWRSHQEVLYGLLVDPAYFPTPRRAAAVESMFSSTVLLAQDSMRSFIEGSAEDRATVLATITGSAHFERCRGKAVGVKDEARRRLRRLEGTHDEVASRARETSARRAELEARVREVRGQIAGPVPSEDLVRAALFAAEIQIADESLTENAVAAVLASCDERLGRLREESIKVSGIEGALESHHERLSRRSQLEAEIERLRGVLGRLQPEIKTCQAALLEAARAAAGARERVQLLQRHREQIATRNRLEGELSRRQDAVAQSAERLESAERRRSTLWEGVSQNRTHAQEARAAFARNAAEEARIGRQIEGLRSLEARLPGLADARTRLESIAAREEELQEEQNRLSRTLGEAQALVRSTERRLEEAARNLDQLRTRADARASLASQLAEYIEGKSCPLCGAEHTSPGRLREAIRAVLDTEPAALSDGTAAVAQLRDQLADSKRAEDAATLAAEAQEEAIRRMAADRTDAERQIQQVLEEGRSIGIDSDAHAVAEALSEAMRLRDGASARRLASARELEEIERHLTTTESDLQLADAELVDLRSKREDAVAALEVVRDELRATRATVESEAPAIAAVEDIHLGLLEAEAHRAEREVARQRAEGLLDRRRRDEREAREARETADLELGRTRQEIALFCERAERVGVVDLTSPANIGEVRASLEARIGRLSEASSTAAAWARAERLRDLDREALEAKRLADDAEREVEALNSDVHKLRWAMGRAQEWEERLATEVRGAIERSAGRRRIEIERHFKSMVPSPHLFEEIAVGYQGERLELGVRYRGQKREAGDPRFFLSNAQGNVLAIAIFLSLAAKRTWCRMDTLLMDDPVQHLDDLDAVALLDAIREAAMGRFGTRKQVVVSTCDRNLYLLMLRKFRALQDHGLSCTGISLVDRGRLGPEVVYDTGGPERVSASA